MNELTLGELLALADTIGSQSEPIDEENLPSLEELFTIAETLTA